MFCSQCGAPANGNFCSACGAQLPSADVASTSRASQEPPADWAGVIDYQMLLKVPMVRNMVAEHAAQAQKRMSAEEFLRHCDKAFKPLTGISVATVTSVVQPLYAELGIRTGKTHSQLIDRPPGHVLLSLLCSLARRGRSVEQVRQVEDGCVLHAELPSDVWSFRGNLVVTVRRAEDGTLVEAGTSIPGQLFDWGKSQRCLQEVFADLSTPPVIS